MYEPKTFEGNNNCLLHSTAAALERTGHLIKWRPDNMDTILDVGCGPGNILVDVILSKFKGKYSLCYATDVSKTMVDFGSKKYEDRKDVKFLELDAMKVDDFIRKYGQVDHVVSSFAIHWLPDQDAGLNNIFKMLRPGGDFFTNHVSSCFIFELYANMDQYPKWNQYFEDIQSFCPPSQKSQRKGADLMDHLTRIGFAEVVVDHLQHDLKFDSMDRFLDFLSSVVVQINKVPSRKRQEFLQFIIDYALEKNGLIVLPTGVVVSPIGVFVAFGRKPE